MRALLLLLLLACGCSQKGPCGPQPGAPWSQFGGGADQAFRSPALGPASARILWSHSSFANLTVSADHTLYVNTSSVVAVTDDATIKWATQDYANGPPAIDAAGHLIISTDSALLAVNAKGVPVWQQPLTRGLSSPLLSADGSIHVIDTMAYRSFDCDGTALWTRPLPVYPIAFAVGPDGTSYLLDESRLTAVDRDGGERWSVDKPSVGPVTVAPDGSLWVGGVHVVDGESTFFGLPLGRGPAIAADGTIYLGVGGSLRAFSPQGQELWHDDLSGLPSTGIPIVDAAGTVYIVNENYSPIDTPINENVHIILHALKSDGTRLWSLDLGYGVSLPAALGDRRLYLPLYQNGPPVLYAIGE